MKLIDGWRDELNRAWSVRAAIFTALLGVSDQLLQAFASVGMPPVAYSILMVIITVAKVLDQNAVTPAQKV